MDTETHQTTDGFSPKLAIPLLDSSQNPLAFSEPLIMVDNDTCFDSSPLRDDKASSVKGDNENDEVDISGNPQTSLSEDDKTYDLWEDRFHYSSWPPVSTGQPTGLGAGLSNLGNTCFMNAILQCFTHTVPLVKALRSCDHASSSNRCCEGFCVLCAICEHVDLSLRSSGKILSPWKFVDNLSYISSCFMRYQQEDAHEFLQCFLDRLERCSDSVSNGKSTSREDNIVQRVFGGRLVSKLKCCNCGKCSDKYEPLVDLSLEIEDANTLQNALESFTKVETIDDPEVKFKCENCQAEVSREKQLMVDQAPLIASFHLKRFKSDGTSIEKIGKHIDFPLDLDFRPYTNSSEDCNVELKYQLYAIVVHNGFLPTSGHYFSYIRSSQETWHKLDDSMVVQVEEEFVLSQPAYILFYAKDGTPWFSNMMETEMLNVDSSVSNTSPKSVLENVDDEPACYHNGAPRAANIDDCGDATTRDVETALEGIQISDRKDACKVEPMSEVIQICETGDRISFNVSGGSGTSGRNLGCYNSRDGTSECASHVTTNGSYAVRTDETKSVQADRNCKENESFQGYKATEKGGSHPPTSSRYAINGNSHGKPDGRCREHHIVMNRVKSRRSPRKGGRSPPGKGMTPETREAMRYIQSRGTSSKRKQLMACLAPPSDKKKRCRTNSPHKDQGQEKGARICRESKHFHTLKTTCLFQGA